MKSGTVYMPNTAKHSTTAVIQPSQRHTRGTLLPGGVVDALTVDMKKFFAGDGQAGWAAPRWMGLSRTGRFTSPAKIPRPMAMYQTIS